MFRFLFFLIFLPYLTLGDSCPNESYEWQTKCYFFINQSTGFPDAEVHCNLVGGHLISIHEGFTNALLTEKARDHFQQSSTANFWIGLSNVATLNNLTWIDGTDLDFIEWDSGQPGNITENSCVGVNLNNGRWVVDDCFKQKPYVCEVEKTNFEQISTTFSKESTITTKTAPTIAITQSTKTFQPISNYCVWNSTYYEPTNTCYTVYYHKDGRDWHFAENLCQSLGGHLPSIHNADELNILERACDYQEGWSPWSGIFSNDNGTTWQWSDGSLYDYNPWDNGQPSLGDPILKCAWIAGQDGLINVNCYTSLAVMCQIKLQATITVSPPITKNCTFANFTYFEPTNSCYGIFLRDFAGVTIGYNWTDSESLCQSVNGHLASIHSGYEMSFLISLMNYLGYVPWTGLYSNDEGETWKWSDGSPWDFDVWDPDIPTLSSNNTCGMLRGDGICNEDCSYWAAPFCKIRYNN